MVQGIIHFSDTKIASLFFHFTMRPVPLCRHSLLCVSVCSRSSSNSLIRCTRRLSTSPAAEERPSFHKRPLPESLISLSSKNGKEIFREALASGGMESYFSLAEQFVTQSEPSYCALSSLAMVLNALNFDPKKVWKGPWRWVSEETLQCETQICGHSLEKVKRDGMDFDEFESLARCHGIRILAHKNYVKNHTESCDRNLSQFRSYVSSVCSSDKSESFIVANFSRRVLGQTGDGHFSPIGGYHKEKDLVLIMDVARFKYPPFWVPLEHLWKSMAVDDAKTNSPRGYFILSTWSALAAEDLNSAVTQSKTAIIHENHKSTCNHVSHSHALAKDDYTSGCPPLIKTWREFKKHSMHGGHTCSVCHTKETHQGI